MSAAALQCSGMMAAAASLQPVRTETGSEEEQQLDPELTPLFADEQQPRRTLAFYRKRTEALLRHYLYASMLVGRTPSMLDHQVARGWASSRPVHTFEQDVNFVLDVEACLARLNDLDRCLLKRIVLQEYTVSETAVRLNLTVNTIVTRVRIATDRLTEILLREDLLVLPQ
jgi:DNA-directed RNA polymerase specialized sigma24 family protein